jgi:predicted negative regulator of RcsB-dependent stress response
LDRLTRKELKTDKFAQEVTHSLAFVGEHRRQAIIYGGGALVVVLALVGFFYYRSHTHRVRQVELGKALRLRDALVTVSPPPDDPRPHFTSKPEKDQAVRGAFNDLINRFPGSDEAYIAHFHLAVLDSDAGNLTEAERHFKIVADNGSAEYSSSAKLSLADVYAGQGKSAQAEALLRDLISHPTLMVSREQATIALARLLATAKPAEARKLLEPLQKDERAAVSRNAAMVAAEIPAK